MVELPGDFHVALPGSGQDDSDAFDSIEMFLTGRAPEPQLDRVLATVMFTDVVGSTPLVARLGDRAWRDLLDR